MKLIIGKHKKGESKSAHPDKTVSHDGAEFDHGMAQLHALYLNERLRQKKEGKHESIKGYEDEERYEALPNRIKENKRLAYAREEKIQRKRDLLPTILF